MKPFISLDLWPPQKIGRKKTMALCRISDFWLEETHSVLKIRENVQFFQEEISDIQAKKINDYGEKNFNCSLTLNGGKKNTILYKRILRGSAIATLWYTYTKELKIVFLPLTQTYLAIPFIALFFSIFRPQLRKKGFAEIHVQIYYVLFQVYTSLQRENVKLVPTEI